MISYKDVQNMLLKFDDSSNSLYIVVMGKENNSLLPVLCSFILSGLWTFLWQLLVCACRQDLVTLKSPT